ENGAHRSASFAVHRRIGYAGIAESGGPQAAGIAAAAGAPETVGVIARRGQLVGDAKLRAAADDVGLAQRDEWSVHAVPRPALDCGRSGEVGERLERADELRTAVGISGVVDRVDADVDVARSEHFRESDGQ